jgi:predicted nucleic acid-binding protein
VDKPRFVIDSNILAIKLRRTGSLKLPDAIIAATAILLKATLLSNDNGLTGFFWPGYTVLPLNFSASIAP